MSRSGVGHPVPILSGEACELAEGAHGIVLELGLDRAQHRAILSRYEESFRSDVRCGWWSDPVRVEKYSDVVKGLKVLTHEPVAGYLDALAAEVEAADLP